MHIYEMTALYFVDPLRYEKAVTEVIYAEINDN